MQSQATQPASRPVIQKTETQPVRLVVIGGAVCRVTLSQLRELRQNDFR